jgi:hypothetical protein
MAGLVMPWMLSRSCPSQQVSNSLASTQFIATHNLAVTLGTALAESLSALSASSHVE